ncbi:hypothetical protein [Actinocatenispora rupis]|uniref:Uncharacterized protein n=1 Tax=Actinocatenispora rupis TaxID=519421 RepID=A0A8J3J935_9ACTN|nr:hypothetical protein [Actinocatenispora rupis]GID12387.1 hypothetical protein Aru02nite_32760 [Actinocatenispora rupis]
MTGHLAELDTPGRRIPIRTGANAQGLLDLLTEMRAVDPAEPFWRGVTDIQIDSDTRVITEFTAPVEPHLLPQDEVAVSCRLYDHYHSLDASGP